MAGLSLLLATLCLASTALADLVGIPIVPFTASNGRSFDLGQAQSIIVDSRYAQTKDTNGWTLIPPTLSEFANTFAKDFQYIVGKNVSVGQGWRSGGQSIFLTVGNNSQFTDAAGRWTSEAYAVDVTDSGITILGASPLGVWWGTRSLLQQAALIEGKMQMGKGTDAPGWGTRGIFVSL